MSKYLPKAAERLPGSRREVTGLVRKEAPEGQRDRLGVVRPDFAAIWKRVSAELARRNGGSLDMWFQQVRDVTEQDSKVLIRVPNSFTRDWIKEKYGEVIPGLLRQIAGKDYELDFIIECTEDGRVARRRSVETKVESGKLAIGGRNPFSAPAINERFTFENFVEGHSNRLASETAKMVAWQREQVVSPIFIHGPTGFGKTHLLCAIYNARRKMGEGDGVIYVSAETFLNQFIESISSKNMKAFRDLYRKECTTLLIDDMQFLSSKHKTQEEFFHCFNELYCAGKTIVMACDRPPGQLDKVEEGLRSRFQGGLVVDIQPLDFDTKLLIVNKKAEALGLDISHELAVLVTEQTMGSVREIEGILIRLKMQSRIRKVPVTKDLLLEVLTNIAPTVSTRPGVEEVLRHVAAAYGLKVSDLRGKKRHLAVALPRQVAMFICREHLKMSYPAIAERMGGRNHTTVIVSCRKIRDQMSRDISLFSTVERLVSQMGLATTSNYRVAPTMENIL